MMLRKLNFYRIPFSRFFTTFPTRLPYKVITPEDISYFRSFLQPNEVITDPNELLSYNMDWKKIYQGCSGLLLKPNSTHKISQILKYCNTNKIAVVPQGGNTGLVGGSTPIHDEIILSLSNLNKIHEFNKHSSVITCDAGCILEEVNNYLLDHKFEIPLDLGAKGSCQLGGNIATHAGGIHFIKYGPLRANILGLEVVLPSGEILNMESEIRKDNTGYDLKQIFIGSEGTLGIITKANIFCVRRDEFKRVLLFKCKSYEEVLKIHDISKEKLGNNLSALEFMDHYAYKSVIEHIPGLNPPFPVDSSNESYYILVELGASHSLDNIEQEFYEYLGQKVDLNDCVLCENDMQALNIWKIRESIATASGHMGSFLIYDFSLDITKWPEFINDIRNKTKNMGYTVGYGHVGDGNLHVNVVYQPSVKKQDLESILEPYCFEWLKKYRGSISAEHGIGFMKANYLNYAKDKVGIDYLKKMKKVFDPNFILNPYKMFPY